MNKFLKKLITFVFFLIEMSLVFRLILKLFGSSEGVGFVDFIYQNTLPLLLPFLLAFPQPSVNGKFVLEFTTLFAIFVYAFMGYLTQEALNFINNRK